MVNSVGSSIVSAQETCCGKACGRGGRTQDQGRGKKGKADGNFKFQADFDFNIIPVSIDNYTYQFFSFCQSKFSHSDNQSIT